MKPYEFKGITYISEKGLVKDIEADFFQRAKADPRVLYDMLSLVQQDEKEHLETQRDLMQTDLERRLDKKPLRKFRLNLEDY